MSNSKRQTVEKELKLAQEALQRANDQADELKKLDLKANEAFTVRIEDDDKTYGRIMEVAELERDAARLVNDLELNYDADRQQAIEKAAKKFDERWKEHYRTAVHARTDARTYIQFTNKIVQEAKERVEEAYKDADPGKSGELVVKFNRWEQKLKDIGQKQGFSIELSSGEEESQEAQTTPYDHQGDDLDEAENQNVMDDAEDDDQVSEQSGAEAHQFVDGGGVVDSIEDGNGVQLGDEQEQLMSDDEEEDHSNEGGQSGDGVHDLGMNNGNGGVRAQDLFGQMSPSPNRFVRLPRLRQSSSPVLPTTTPKQRKRTSVLKQEEHEE